MQLSLDYVLEEWDKDSFIDPLKLDRASLSSAKLHSKYLRMYSKVKMMLKAEELKMEVTKRDLRLHFERKLTREVIDHYGWSLDPFGGLSVLKSDMESWSRSHPDIQSLERMIDQLKVIRDALKEIMDSIKWRSSSIKNAIDYRRFMDGG